MMFIIIIIIVIIIIIIFVVVDIAIHYHFSLSFFSLLCFIFVVNTLPTNVASVNFTLLVIREVYDCSLIVIAT